MAVYVDLLAYLSIVITSQTKYSEPPSQGSIWETCEIFEENRKKKEIREQSKVRIKGMINSVIACWRKIEPLWCIFSKNAWVPCNAVKVAGLVEEVNGQCDMIHQDAGNFKTRSIISLLLGTLTWVPCNAEKVADVVEEVSRRCDVIHQDAGNLNKIEYIITSPGPGWSKMGCEYLIT